MRITSAGNVGIGTISPGSKLSVVGGISSTLSYTLDRNGSDGLYTAFYQQDTLTSTAYAINMQMGNTGGFNFWTYNGSWNERVRFTSGGSVGINNTSPFNSAWGNETNSKQLSIDATSAAVINLKGGTRTYSMGNTGNYFYMCYDNTAARHNLTASDSGNILINGITDAGYRLYVVGTIYATGNITANSDLTLKKNLTLVDNPIDKLNQLNGYLYQWKEDDSYQYGVIAQEVEKILPHAVSTGKNGIKGVAYNQLTPLLIEGFKVHETELQTLKKRVAYLETKLG
jgi:hypothetical protein